MDRLYRHVTQIPPHPVSVGEGVTPFLPTKLAEYLEPKGLQGLSVITVMPRQTVPAAGGCNIGLMHIERPIREAPDAHHVVLVHMPQDHEIATLELLVQLERYQWSVKHRNRVAPSHDQLIAVRVFAQ
jgi:hypothetical protein